MSEPVVTPEPEPQEKPEDLQSRVSLVQAFDDEIEFLLDTKKLLTKKNKDAIDVPIMSHIAMSLDRIKERWLDTHTHRFDLDKMTFVSKEKAKE